jgi:type I site-specific restriction endonuclease
MIDKKQLSERDICSKFITPSLQKAGWDLETQILEEVPLLQQSRQYAQQLLQSVLKEAFEGKYKPNEISETIALAVQE